MAVWPLVSSDALSRHFPLYFCLLMCRRPLQLWGFGYSLTDRLVSSVFGTWFATIYHSTCGCLTTPQPTRSRLALSSDMRVLISNDHVRVYLTLLNIVDSGARFARGVLWCMLVHFDFHRVLSVVAIRIIGACLSTSSRRLLLCYWATPVGSSPVTSTSFTTVL